MNNEFLIPVEDMPSYNEAKLAGFKGTFEDWQKVVEMQKAKERFLQEAQEKFAKTFK